MPTVQVEAQLSADELLQAVQQLSRTELEQFVVQVVTLRAKHQAPSLPKDEAELLQKINQGIPPEFQKRHNELIVKRRAEELTSEEHAELLRISDQVEKLAAQRAEYLSKLACLRKTTITDLMKDIEIQPPAYA